MGYSRRGQNSRGPLILLVCLCFLIVAAAAVMGIGVIRKLAAERASLQSAVASLEEVSRAAEEGNTSGEQLPEEGSAQAEGSDPGSSQVSGQQTEQTEPPTEQTEPPATEALKVETLDGVAAGTVYTAADLDLDHLEKYFQAYEIRTTGAVYGRINGKSYRDNPNVALGDLRYLKVLHYNFNHQIQVGEIIVNQSLAEDVKKIFREFFDAEYEIQSMHLVDNYWTGDGDTSDSASIDVNNTSAFNYRAVTGGSKLSNHAYGCAIDINPQQNPYVSYSSGSPRWSHQNANAYIDRSTGMAHVITHEDLAYRIFSKYGFNWGGDWNTIKDYQHFERR